VLALVACVSLRPFETRVTAVQATVHTFNPVSGDGSVITDDGEVFPFDAASWQQSPARFFRVGQRVRIHLEDADVDGASGSTISSLTLATFPYV
jgi:hypothetical protein